MTGLEPVESICPFCAVGCTLAYDEEAGRASGRIGAANPDGQLCPKGIRAYEPLGRDDRLTTPLVREDGQLREASWEDALTRAAEDLLEVRERAGPDAVAFLGAPHCTNEENYLFAKIARLIGTNNLDNRARICHAATARAMRERLGCDAMTNSIADLAAADAFLIVGANPAERQPVAFNTAVRRAKTRGATVVHVDPRANATTRVADYHLAPHPGTDGLVLVAMAGVIVAEDWVDKAFIETRTTGFDGYAELVRDMDPRQLAAAAGVDPGTLRAAARAFAAVNRAAVICGTGIEPSDHETTTTADAVVNLLLLTGNLGRTGTGMNLFRGLNNEQGAIDMGCRPFSLPGGVPVTDDAGRRAIADEWGSSPPATPGRSELEVVKAAGSDIRGAWVLGENPAVSTLDVDVEARLAALDVLVVQDVFRSETAELADVVLPASAWAEKAGTVTNMDRQVQRMRPATSPPEQARLDLWILCALGRRITGDSFSYAGPRVVFEEITRVTPTYAGLSFDRVSSAGQRWPLDAAHGSGVSVLHRGTFASGARRAPFRAVPIDGDAGSRDDLVLLGGRPIDEFGGVFDTTELWIQLNPQDANTRRISDGDTVAVSAGGVTIEVTADVTPAVREGVAFAHASVIDELGAGGGDGVQVSLAAS